VRLSRKKWRRRAIPTDIGKRIQLELLDLGSDSFRNAIPTEMGLLAGLKQFIPIGDFLPGSIPSSLGMPTQLSSLDLNANGLKVHIPPRIDGLALLLILDLSRNNWSSVPPTIGLPLSRLRLGMSQNEMNFAPFSSQLGDSETPLCFVVRKLW
jgi:Leucine-rich repeat (LRR) protein